MKSKAMFATLFLICILAASTTTAAAATPPTLGSIDVEKYVSFGSDTNTVSWLDADDVPGPYALAGGEVYFKYRVENTGETPFFSVRLLESPTIALRGCTVLEPLMPGAVFECVVGPFPIGPGQNMLPVTAVGYFDGGWAQDRDNANYFGAVVALDLETYVRSEAQENWTDADDPPGLYVTAGSSIYLQYEGTNRGNVPLYGISLRDALAGVDQVHCVIVEPLLPGASFSCISGPITAAAGPQNSAVTARGRFLDWVVEDNDDTHYFGVLAQIDVEDEIGIERPDTNAGPTGIKWFDADDPPGLELVVGAKYYRKWSGTNTGNVPLEHVEVLADVTEGAPHHCLIFEPVMPGASFECICGPFHAAPGVQANKTTIRGTFASWSTEDSDSTYYQGVYVAIGSADEAKVQPAR
jgi:hypothetical protein